MKLSELKKGAVYIDKCKNYAKFKFTGEVSQVLNTGYNTYFKVAKFEAVECHPIIAQGFKERGGVSYSFDQCYPNDKEFECSEISEA